TASRPAALSCLPMERAKPMLVVARASKPKCSSIRAVPASQGLGMMKALLRSCKVRKAFPFSACVAMISFSLWNHCRDSQRTIHNFHEIAFFAKDQLLRLGKGEVLATFLIRF